MCCTGQKSIIPKYLYDHNDRSGLFQREGIPESTIYSGPEPGIEISEGVHLRRITQIRESNVNNIAKKLL
ncbi:hypothetical protein AMTR_s02353p00005690, partial [Amborella trichopoda]